ncbi:hypothetical protein ILUMI_03932 [Ignelater luminosus]|uniref:SCP domain-containing protein n=1 Tax=Ignelater luminosus TaxID=2038154 RepID=A0A8K0DFP0_IGNLU|nr:hypothetical protein ILUMI_03932 [Ignelater luminosus]
MLKYYFLLISISHGAIAHYFCDFPCGKEHTVCKRDPCYVSKACGANASSLGLDDEGRQWILDLHNNYRNNIALGKDTTGGNGQASNMLALNYDRELEFVAQCWSNACAETGNSHDTCRTTKKFRYVGQNMYSSGSSVSIDFSDKKFLTNAVEAWYSEIKMSNGGEIDSYKDSSGSIGHFTQVVWAETSHVGCGRTFYMSQNNFFSVYIYCNYGSGGNVVGTPVYRRGQPCSNCGRRKCNSKYTGLCGAVNKLSSDDWDSPFRMAGSRLQTSIYTTLILIITLLFL